MTASGGGHDGDGSAAGPRAGAAPGAQRPLITTAPPAPPGTASDPRPRHVIIVGFGLSGRTAANTLEDRGIPFAVIETNADVVARCTKGGLNIILGDARHEDVLRTAGIDRATDVAVTMPSDQVTLEVVERARQMNGTCRIVARCTFVSGGLEATRRGADDVVIAESVVAAEFGKVIGASMEPATES